MAPIMRRVSGSLSVPSNSGLIQAGTLAPHMALNRAAWV